MSAGTTGMVGSPATPTIPVVPADTHTEASRTDPSASATADLSLKEFIMGMEGRLTTSINVLNRTLQDTNTNLMRLDAKVDANDVALRQMFDAGVAKLDDRIDAVEDNFEKRVADIVSKKLSDIGFDPDLSAASLKTVSDRPNYSAVQGPAISAEQRNEEKYWAARKILKIWPVQGDDLVNGLLTFAKDRLRIEDTIILQEIGRAEVRRYVDPKSKIAGIVIATFPSREVRDAVKAAATNLAGSQAGVRMFAPTHLRNDMRVLEKLAYEMKSADGSIRRSIKLDDETLGIILDVKKGNEPWKRISAAQAREIRAAHPSLSTSPAMMSNEDISEILATQSTPATGANATPRGES